MTLTEFLLARIAEDVGAAQAAFSGQGDPENGWGIEGRAITPHVGLIHEDVQREHVAKWNPARVLAECEAKRRIVEIAVGDLEARPNRREGRTRRWRGHQTLRLLALPYAGHGDYNDDWRL